MFSAVCCCNLPKRNSGWSVIPSDLGYEIPFSHSLSMHYEGVSMCHNTFGLAMLYCWQWRVIHSLVSSLKGSTWWIDSLTPSFCIMLSLFIDLLDELIHWNCFNILTMGLGCTEVNFWFQTDSVLMMYLLVDLKYTSGKPASPPLVASHFTNS